MQLRSGRLPLALEAGGFNDTAEEDRLCLLCDLGEIEDEFHFLFCCPVYDDLREIIFTKMLSVVVDFSWLAEYETFEFHSVALIKLSCFSSLVDFFSSPEFY